jgi:sugar phosphate isomerase/epimerase
MKSAITISLVPEARGGPFVFWDDLPAACRKAKALGFDAVEIFAPGPDAIHTAEVRKLTGDMGLSVAAVGTGAGWVKHKLHLVLPDAASRRKAIDFIKSIIDMGAKLNAPAIIGSMQGRWSANPADGLCRDVAFPHFRDALNELGEHAKQQGTMLLYEPLNRYETNMVNTTAAGVELLQSLATKNVKLLSDLFHMNIEEADIPTALRMGGSHIEHIHFVDSNRRPAGCGHMDYAPILAALKEIGYAGHLSAEALPWPDPDAAAKQTIEMYRKLQT